MTDLWRERNRTGEVAAGELTIRATTRRATREASSVREGLDAVKRLGRSNCEYPKQKGALEISSISTIG
jgi:hypothetical protein